MKVRSSLSALVFNKKVQNKLILYLQGQVSTRNLSSNIVKLKEPWTEKHLKAIQIIFHLYLLYIYCQFPKDVLNYFTMSINSLQEKYQKYRDHEFYTKNYEAIQVLLGWSN